MVLIAGDSGRATAGYERDNFGFAGRLAPKLGASGIRMESLTIPDRLYGRENQIRILLEAFERCGRGGGEVLLLPGQSGVGKTSLVLQLREPVRARNGFFVQGKFEQYQQNIPYFAFKQALAGLCRELMSDDEARKARFKADILEALENHGQLLIDLVPEFESFLGPQPAVGDISPQEARHRFASVFQRFLKVICQPDHPLVLSLDDWHWADAASLSLLVAMHSGAALKYILVIMAFRENEVEPGHPLLAAVDNLRNHAAQVAALHVDNITLDDVRSFIVDSLQPSVDDSAGLAAHIHETTKGNPFFVRSLLSFLHEFALLRFDPAAGRWQWNVDEISTGKLPVTLEELFTSKLHELDADGQSVFSLAACLGNRFDIQTLSIISGRAPGECVDLLTHAKAHGLIMVPHCTDDDLEASAPGGGVLYRFLHDRVQQAAYGLIAPEERPAIMLSIGRLLLSSLTVEQQAERIFEVVNAFNAATDLIEAQEEQVRIVELNVAAGRKAYAATAYHSALLYYRAASRFVRQPDFSAALWRDHHTFTLRFFKDWANCEFLDGNYPEAEACVKAAALKVDGPLERAEILALLIQQYTLLARYPEAIAAGREALAALGIYLPEDEYEAARDAIIAEIRTSLHDRSVESLFHLPVMSHPEMLMAAHILITMGPPCYRAHQRLWGFLVPKVVNLTLEHGNIPQVGYSHTAFGGLLGWVNNDYETARDFGSLATQLMTRTFCSPSDQSVFYLMIGSSIRHWFKHLKNSSQDYSDAYEIGVRSSNLQYAAYAFGHNMYCRYFQGIPLPTMTQETQRSLSFSHTRHNQWAIDMLSGGLRVFSLLKHGSLAHEEKEDNTEEGFLRQVQDHHNIQILCVYKVMRSIALLVLGELDEALTESDHADKIIYTVGTQGLLPWPEHVFVRFLIRIALYPKATPSQQELWREEFQSTLAQLKIWEFNCPENYRPKRLIAVAELARIENRDADAMDLYDQAIEAAQQWDFLHWEGFANERAHNLWKAHGNEGLSQVYWQQAYVAYSRWGASSKIESMESAYRLYLAGQMERAGASPFVDAQIRQLRGYASAMEQTRLRLEATAQAEELSAATERLRVEISERRRAEEALQTERERLEGIITGARVGTWEWHVPTGQVAFNERWAEIIGYTLAEISPVSIDTWIRFTHPDDLNASNAVLEELFNGRIDYYECEARMRHRAGHWVWILDRGSVTSWGEDGKPLLMRGTHSDITMSKKAQEALERSLTEKTAMLKEIHHRVKNNLQIVASLLNLQAGRITNADTIVALRDVESRILAMALLHETLYQSGDFARVDFARYLKELCAHVLRSYGSSSSDVTIERRVLCPRLSLDQSIPCGLIISELLSNALKYAFPDDRAGVVLVGLSLLDGVQVLLEFCDNGVGLPVDFEPEKTATLGTRLIVNLVRQLGGQYHMSTLATGGCSVRITFPFHS